MDILSLDVLKLASVFPRVWRRIWGMSPRKNEIILRHNIAGLEIVVVNHSSRVVNCGFEFERMQGDSTASGVTELLYFSIDVERLIESE